MQVGDLVRIKRPGIGIPVNTMALIIKRHEKGPEYEDASSYIIYSVQFIGKLNAWTRYPPLRRYLASDLEVVNESN